MGTSASSKGPGGGVPLVPPWVPAIPENAPPTPDEGNAPTSLGSGELTPTEQVQPTVSAGTALAPIPLIAPANRFGSARRNLGSFARTGNSVQMRRAVRQYVQKGYGGRRNALRRFGGTITSAGALNTALAGLASPSGIATLATTLSRKLLEGRSAREVIDALIESIRPTDGTQDAEAARFAIKDALSDVLTRYPDADLLNLGNEEREFAIERFVGLDVFRRLELDIGASILESSESVSVGLARIQEVRDYVIETVSLGFRVLRNRGERISPTNVARIVRSALDTALHIFEVKGT